MPPWKGHAFVGTRNNYAQEDEDLLNGAPWIDSMIYGREEAPSTGTPHLQFWVWTCVPHQLTQIKRKLPGFVVFTPGKNKPPSYWYEDDGVHKDIAGLPLGYCKKDGDWQDRGTPPSLEQFLEQLPAGQGNRSDILSAKKHIDDGGSTESMLGMDAHFSTMSRHEAFLTKYEAYKNRRIGFHKPEVIVYWGDAGVGKSRLAREAIGDKPFYRHAAAMGKWFDRYAGHDIVWFDEYRPTRFSYNVLCDLLDGHDQYQVEIKNGSVLWSPKVIYMTAPTHPKDWYTCLDPVDGSVDQLLRRITKIIHVSDFASLGR